MRTRAYPHIHTNIHTLTLTHIYTCTHVHAHMLINLHSKYIWSCTQLYVCKMCAAENYITKRTLKKEVKVH